MRHRQKERPTARLEQIAASTEETLVLYDLAIGLAGHMDLGDVGDVIRKAPQKDRTCVGDRFLCLRLPVRSSRFYARCWSSFFKSLGASVLAAKDCLDGSLLTDKP